MKPYAKPQPVLPIGLVRSDGRIVTDDGQVRHWNGRLAPDLVLFADRVIAMAEVGHGVGSVLKYNGNAYRWEHRGRKVHLLAGHPGDGDDALTGLVQWRDHLASYGAKVGSPRQASMSLLRATLTRPLSLGFGAPELREVKGGRQLSGRQPGHYRSVSLWDMSAAYVSAMRSLVYGGTWTEITPDTPDGSVPAIAHATVRIPDMLFGPLPRSRANRIADPADRWTEVREFPVAETVHGYWSFEELRAAERSGAHVKINAAWVMASTRQPFKAWADAIYKGRGLKGYAGKLSKLTGNVLWGSLVGGDGHRSRAKWRDGHYSERPEPMAGVIPSDRALAETICAAVRVRLHDEFLIPNGADVISAHTDGGILQGLGDRFAHASDWRLKGTPERLTYVGPQCFSYSTGDDVTYRVSGVAPDDAARAFRSICEVVMAAPPLPDMDAARKLAEIKRAFGLI